MDDPIPALIKNAKSFSEKGRQIDPEKIVALGIPLFSRYGKINEMIEMLGFIKLAAASAVAHYIRELNYDSKHGSCSVILHDTVKPGSEIERELFRIANQSLHSFQWYGDEYWNIPD